MAQALVDQHRYDGTGAWRLLLRETAAVAATAPKMRWESTMVKVAAAVGIATLVVVLVLVAGPAALLLVAAGAVALLLVGRRGSSTRPVEELRAGWSWFVGGAVALLAAVAIPVLDGGELSEVRWSAMALLGVTGIALVLTGLVTATTRRGAV